MNFYIVIPIHNEAKFIRATILSLTSQTLKPKKILVVNDNSSDDSHKIVKNLESKFPILKNGLYIPFYCSLAPSSQDTNRAI